VGQPYISVIVTAYNRRRYLPFALRSLETQTLPKDKFEVIVVKNFEDKESDDIVSRNGWKYVYNDDPYHGRMVLAGLEESKGEVITFLDDDDMYTNNRLEEVYNVFNSYRDLVYFHNSQEFIDEDGRRLENPLRPSKNLVRGNNIAFNPKALQGVSKRYGMSIADLILKYVRARADFNNSSVAVRRHIVESHAQLLKRLPASIDSFTFAASLRSGGLFYFTDKKLTLYRVHSASASIYVLGKGPEAYIRQAKYLLQFNEAYNIIGSELLEGGLNVYICSRLLQMSELWLIPLDKLKELPSELRPKPSDLARALECVTKGLSRRLTLPLVLASLVLGHAKQLKGRIYRLLGRLI
jgi:glycosyltransferase involved in cell wall biosynthesis